MTQFGKYWPDHDEKEQWLDALLKPIDIDQTRERQAVMMFLLAKQYEERWGVTPVEALQHVHEKITKKFTFRH